MTFRENEPFWIGLYCGVLCAIILGWCLYTDFLLQAPKHAPAYQADASGQDTGILVHISMPGSVTEYKRGQ
jgi:hypothetical protein